MSLSPSRSRSKYKKHKRSIAKQSKKSNRSKKNHKPRTRKDKCETNYRQLRREKNRIKEMSQKISNHLGSLDHLAKKTGFIRRQGKISSLAFVTTLAYGLFGAGNKSLALLASNMKSWFDIEITPQALSKRLKERKTMTFLKHTFTRVLDFQLCNAFKNKYADLFNHFTAIKIEDSTSFELHEALQKDFKGTGGAGSKAGMKLNVCYDLTRSVVSNVDISSGTQSDQKFANNVEKTMKKGELLIRDLGYFNLEAMREMIERGIYFLSRLQKGINVFLDATQTTFDFYHFLGKETSNGNIIDRDVYVGEMKVPVRLIAIQVPEEVKQKRIKRFKKVRKRDATKEYVIWSGFSIFVTNIPRSMLSSEMIITIYKIRWQIELFFKMLKGTLSINIIRTENKNSTLCMIYAKLISLLVASVVISYAESICDEKDELSLDKAMKWLHNDNCFGRAVVENTLEELLKSMIIELRMICKDKRRKRKSTYKILEEMNAIDEAA